LRGGRIGANDAGLGQDGAVGMVQVRYLGIGNPKAAFARLKPLRDEIMLRPFGTDYLILDALTKALDTAAYHFTREPDFYSMKPAQSDYRPPPT
jgi:hypothetical protein